MSKQTDYDPARICTMTDAILSIVITLLVFNITIFVVPHINHWVDFYTFFQKIYHHFFNFIVLFILSGWMWFIHHTIFVPMKRVDRTVIILNMGALMLMCFIPMCLNLIKDNPHHFLPELFLWIVYILLLGSFVLIMKSVRSKPHLHNKRVIEAHFTTAKREIIFLGVTGSVAMSLSYISPGYSILAWIVLTVIGMPFLKKGTR